MVPRLTFPLVAGFQITLTPAYETLERPENDSSLLGRQDNVKRSKAWRWQLFSKFKSLALV